MSAKQEFFVAAAVVITLSLLIVAWVQHRDGPVDDEGGVPTVHRMAGRARFVYAALGVVGLTVGLVIQNGLAIAFGVSMLAAAWGQQWVHDRTGR